MPSIIMLVVHVLYINNLNKYNQELLQTQKNA
jgi:hypothetical protein